MVCIFIFHCVTVKAENSMNTYPKCGSPPGVLHLRDRHGGDLLRYRNRAEITVFMCERKPYPVWFSCRPERLSGTVWTAIQYVTLYFADRRGAASLRDRNGAEIIVFDCKKKLCPVWISCRGKNHAILCEYSLKSGLKGVAFIGRRNYIEGVLLQSFPLKEL